MCYVLYIVVTYYTFLTTLYNTKMTDLPAMPALVNSIVFLLSLLPMLTAKCGNTKPKKSKGELWWFNLTSRKLDLTKILFFLP